MRAAALLLAVGMCVLPLGGCEGYGFGRRGFCKRGESCWPSEKDVERLRKRLDPDMPRMLRQEEGAAYVSPPLTPINGLEAKPLYGLGETAMEALYVRGDETNGTCREEGKFVSGFCKAQATNAPLRPADPDFVVFALTGEHVRAVVQFARRHRLCIGVAGTGHDFNGRNQPYCDGGSVLLRTTLMRSKEADLEDEAMLGHESFRFGAGTGFSEAQEFAAQHGRVVASGACETVGLVGWTLGGGHGPLGPWLGLGADNLLAVDLVLANGRYVTATADGPFADLFRALKGGGGSTWGIVTHITVKAHMIPPGGFTVVTGQTRGDLCEAGTERLRETVAAWQRFNLEMTSRGANAYYVVTMRSDDGECSNDWWMVASYSVISGGTDHEQTAAVEAHLAKTGAVSSTVGFANWYQGMKFRAAMLGEEVANYLKPWRDHPRPLAGALVQRHEADELTAMVTEFAETYKGYGVQIVTSGLTGNVGSPQPDDNSLSRSMRTAMSLYMSYEVSQDEMLKRLGSETYFSESSYNITDGRAFWGDKYWELLLVKRRYDPRGVFGCRGCVGTDDTYEP